MKLQQVNGAKTSFLHMAARNHFPHLRVNSSLLFEDLRLKVSTTKVLRTNYKYVEINDDFFESNAPKLTG